MDITMEGLEPVNMEMMMEFLQTKRVYRCTFVDCKAYFDRPYRLAQHILAHNNIRPYLCNEPNCGKAYTSKSHLDRHLRNVHMPHQKDVVMFSCPRCFKTFANRQNLKRHLNTVHEVEFSCEVCDMQFKKKNQLSTHMYEHTGIKAFSCELCSETFVSLYLKKRHMRYHKKYTCQECNEEFNHWSKYQKHLKCDHIQNEFICNECGRTFKQRCHIVRHVKIHEAFCRTFECPYENCDRSYSRKSNLKQHILVKHMNVLHECVVCHARLSTKAKLNYHVQLHFASGKDEHSPNSGTSKNKERNTRKDEGSFKSSTALRLAGLSRAPDELLSTSSAAPDDLPSTSRMDDDLQTSSDDIQMPFNMIPDDFQSSFASLPEHIQSTLTKIRENLQSSLTEVQEELRSTLSGLTEMPEELESGQPSLNDTPEDSLANSQSSPPLNLTIKTEYIEVEVDIPYDV